MREVKFDLNVNNSSYEGNYIFILYDNNDCFILGLWEYISTAGKLNRWSVDFDLGMDGVTFKTKEEALDFYVLKKHEMLVDAI